MSVIEQPEDEVDPEDLFGVASDENPVWVGAVFLNNLMAPEGDDDELRARVTPETVDEWDFPELRAFLQAEPDLGLAQFAHRVDGAADVMFLKLVIDHRTQLKPGSEGILTVTAPTEIKAHILTLVWRPELQSWRVCGFGDHVPLEDIARTSPNDAPAIDRLSILNELDDLPDLD